MSNSLIAKITFISAGAGSGKTHRLTEILHRELTSKAIRPAGVIAITFTRKAAAELRERTRAHLLGKGDFALANAMGQARIGTVNSVCGQLIDLFAFEAGRATGQQVLEETQASLMLGKAIDKVMSGASMSDFLKLANRMGLDENWKIELKQLVDQIRYNDIATERLAGFAASNAKDLLSHFPRPARQDLAALLKENVRQGLAQLTAAASDKKNTNDYLSFLRLVDRALGDGSATWGDWVKLSTARPEAKLAPIVEPVVEAAARFGEHPALHADITRYLAQIFDLAERTLVAFSNDKRELGVLDFADQEHLLLGLLDHPTVIEVLTEELDLLMVDEFQDTSPIQLALFLKLARFAKRVYWVGDIKQAIYGFRGSDTELMRAILDELPNLGAAKEVLPYSWRSRKGLVDVVNAVFVPAFETTLSKDEIRLEAKRKDSLPGAPLANWMLGGKSVAQQASALAAGIRKLVESRYQVIEKDTTESRDVRYGDIAILCKTNVRIGSFASALRDHGVPSATAQPGLLATPEATLALACLRRLNDPGDTIATAEIVSLSDCAEPETWVADRLRHLARGAPADAWMEKSSDGVPAHPLVSKIAALRESLPVFAPKEALQTVIAACDLASIVIRWSPDTERCRMRLGNLEALINLATQYEDLCRSAQHAASISGLQLWLAETAEGRQDMLAEPAIDAVKILTWHGAKGLEWPVVILADLATDIRDRLWSISAGPGAKFDVQAPLEGRIIRYWPWPFGKLKNVGLADDIARAPVAEAFRQAALDETKRLVYVAMTRARDLMVLARSDRKLNGEWLDSVEAPWLLPADDEEFVTLPSGKTIRADLWTLNPLVDAADLAQPLPPVQWFLTQPAGRSRLPLSFSPSASGKVARAQHETCRIGQRIAVREGTDMNVLGTALHACLALSFTDPDRPLEISDVERLLAAFGVREEVSGEHVLAQSKALHGWIASRWPGARVLAEYPVQSLPDSCQVLNGRLDVVLETSQGFVLIDHKSSPLAAAHWERLAEDYSAQLGAYADAITRATGKPVTEQWLFLPVAAGGLRIA